MSAAPPSPPSKRSGGKKVFPLLVLAIFVLTLSSCCCCIMWFRVQETGREDAAAVGQATRLLELRGQLDRIHEAFPTDIAPSACAETPPDGRVVVLLHAELGRFRSGDGVHPGPESSIDVISSHIHGHDRPADDISDGDAYRQLEQLFSTLREVDQTQWLAVVRTRDVAMPAVAFNTFDPGRYIGDVVVFERATGRVLCAQQVSAASSPSLDIGTFEGGADAGRRDLATQLTAAKEQTRQALSPALQLDW